MLDSVPLALRAIFWLLAGAALILAVGRFLPNWLRRFVALVASLGSLGTLWSLRSDVGDTVEIFWEPVNLFRMSPLLRVDGESLGLGIILVAATAVLVLGIRGHGARRTLWHGSVLVVMAGILLMLLAASLPTLAFGSGLVDLALMAMAVLSTGDTGRGAWRMAVPGVASTMLLVAAGLQMSTEVGTTLLSVGRIPDQALVLIGIAGLLRILIFPLHPRSLGSPQNAATLILLVGSGLYLLVQAQASSPVLADHSWMLKLAGAALLAGGVFAWAGEGWIGVAIHQTGLALALAFVSFGAMPWLVVGLVCALGILTIWWDSGLEQEEAPRPGWTQWFVQQTSSSWRTVTDRFAASTRGFERMRAAGVSRYRAVLLPAIALFSLAGVPFTAGAASRWAMFGERLETGGATSLTLFLVADTFLVAGLWQILRGAVRQAERKRPGVAPLLAMAIFAILTLVIGIAPGLVASSLDQSPMPVADVSVLGLGFIYILPWLLGSWLARTEIHRSPYLAYARGFLNLDWLYRAASWTGQQLSTGIYWLGRVGEGDGWWGWALIILALGAILFSSR